MDNNQETLVELLERKGSKYTPPISHVVVGNWFGFYDAAQIKRLAVKRIHDPVSLDDLNVAKRGGLYDPALGVSKFGAATCETCFQTHHACPGHLGYIELPVPVYHPLLFEHLVKLLKGMCIQCNQFRYSRAQIHCFTKAMQALSREDMHGYLAAARELELSGASASADVEDSTDAPLGKRKKSKKKSKKKAGNALLGQESDDEQTQAMDVVDMEAKPRPQPHVPGARGAAGADDAVPGSAARPAGFVGSAHVLEERRALLRRFFTGIPRRCANCKCISPRYQSVKPLKIFQKRLSGKDRKLNDAADCWNDDRMKVSSELFSAADLAGAGKDVGGGRAADDEDEDTDAYTDEEEAAAAAAKRKSKKGAAKENNSTKNKKRGSGGKGATSDEDADEEEEEEAEGGAGGTGFYLPPGEVMARIERLFEAEHEVLREVFGAVRNVNCTLPAYGGDAAVADARTAPEADEVAAAARVDDTGRWLFFEVIPVPPNRFRPAGLKSEKTGLNMDHPQNVYFAAILTQCREMQRIMSEKKKGTYSGKSSAATALLNTWLQLQDAVNMLIDNQGRVNASNMPMPPGVRQILDKKQGLFRQNMMGKRVDSAARSVISPDPYLRTCEIGVPLAFASTLLFPEKVTAHNVRRLHRLVERGPDWPGCGRIEIGGRSVALAGKDANERKALAKRLLTLDVASAEQGNTGDRAPVVYRHLMNGDYVIMNRQPTLHKPSMMAFQVRVIDRSDRVLRMHYANCKTFNADFDGDEMNMHFPQSFLARAETASFMHSNMQYIVPTNGGPLRGLIQDHVVSAVLLTKRDSFFTREQAVQLLFGACFFVNPERRIRLGPPCILKPRRLWSGKQIITALLQHVTCTHQGTMTITCKGKVPGKLWGDVEADSGEPGEHSVVVRDNEVLTGVLDKAQIGNSKGGIVHAVHELFGPIAAGDLLSCFSRVFTDYLQYHGFTCGVDDLLLRRGVDVRRESVLTTSTAESLQGAMEFLGDAAAAADGGAGAEAGGVAAAIRTAKLRSAMRDRLRDPAEAVRLDNVMKGRLNKLTSSVIKASVPSGQWKRFPHNNLSLMTISGAKGSEVNVSQISCCLGQQVLEGRRVPMMVTGKTLPSFDPYDLDGRAGGFIVDRFLTGLRPQEYYFHCMAGREGLVDTAVKTSNSGYLQRCLIKHLEGLCVSYDMTVRSPSGDVVQFFYGDDGIDPMRASSLADLPFLATNQEAVAGKLNVADILSRQTFGPVSAEVAAHADQCQFAPDNEKPLPVMSVFNPHTQLGVVSERFEGELNRFADQEEHKFFEGGDDAGKGAFRTMMYLKYLNSLVDAGDSVGLLASQSIGEPSTQMTLNTFHLAGHGGANVTLGIPRLREIIMVASTSIKTPTMSFPLRAGTSKADAVALLHRLHRLALPEILSGLDVTERVKASEGTRSRRYRLRFTLPAMAELQEVHGVSYRLLERAFLVLAQSVCMAVKEIVKHGSSLSTKTENAVISRTVRAMTAGDEAADDEEADDTAMDGEPDDADAAGSAGATRTQAAGKGASLSSQITRLQAALNHKCKPEYDGMDISTGGENVTVVLDVSVRPDAPKMLMLQMAERIAARIVVIHTPGIKKCFLAENKERKEGGGATTTFNVTVEGVNVPALFPYSRLIEMDRILSNDIHHMLGVYGVEAARATIVREIKGVFGAYGIGVDPRHLSLLADYMTQSGGYRPLNRIGIEAAASAWQRISYESTTQFLRDAAMHGLYDDLASPSARLVLGQPVRNGTGFCEVLHKFPQ